MDEQTSRVAWVDGFEGRVVLLRLAPLDATPLVLEATAADIWRMWRAHADRGHVIATLAEDYAVDPSVLAPDVHRLLDQLSELGIE